MAGLRSIGALLVLCQALVGCGKAKDGAQANSVAGQSAGGTLSLVGSSPANVGMSCDATRRSAFSLAIRPSEICPEFGDIKGTATIQPLMDMGYGSGD